MSDSSIEVRSFYQRPLNRNFVFPSRLSAVTATPPRLRAIERNALTSLLETEALPRFDLDVSFDTGGGPPIDIVWAPASLASADVCPAKFCQAITYLPLMNPSASVLVLHDLMLK